jgi:hypothetical protein
MKTCKNCILPENYVDRVTREEIDFNSKGICGPCQRHEEGKGFYGTENDGARDDLAKDFEKVIEEAKDSDSKHKAIIGLSGGKDSAYLALKAIRDYELNPFLFTVDTGFPSEMGKSNIEYMLNEFYQSFKGKFDYEYFDDKDYKDMLKKIYRRQLTQEPKIDTVHEVCYYCAPLMEDVGLNLAVKEGIPLVLMGYSPGQPDEDFMIYRMDREKLLKSHIPEWMADDFSDKDRSFFWNPEDMDPDVIPEVIAPFHVTGYNENYVIKAGLENNLFKSKRRTDPTFTNCMLNWVMMIRDIHRDGFNPYIGEFAKKVRQGEANRLRWKYTFRLFDALMSTKPFKNRIERKVLSQLDLTFKDLGVE